MLLKLFAAAFIAKNSIPYSTKTLVNDCIELIERFKDKQGLRQACLKGDYQTVIVYLQHRGFDCKDSALIAAQKGHIDILRLLIASGAKNYNKIMVAAAKCPSLPIAKEIIQWMIDLEARAYNKTLCTAAGYGHIEIIKWMIYRLEASDVNGALQYACQRGQKKVVSWLLEKEFIDLDGCKAHDMVVAIANKYGYKKIIDVAVEFTSRDTILDHVISGNYTNVIEWVVDVSDKNDLLRTLYIAKEFRNKKIAQLIISYLTALKN